MCQNEPNPESQIKDFRGFSSLRELGNAANGIFLFFPMLGKSFFADFLFSQCWEGRFSAFFDFLPWRKVDFRRFLIFPRGGKSIFSVF